eukprot:CAMPEP_0194221170 /NCGR_PEP_ID=MMETSP0156-20130528/30035_1 /TAXON_ID=33649 /ORGANISM="Thalassionema nitzschioides, Strain L26-B" /LENGTH=176 /DNA_ID=CAMNT_0038951485 /DNA_START=12 /DNA_END=542 /DNA_ORIENTATION=+
MNKESVLPTPKDVLCGRGVTCYQHEGNQQFRTIIALHLPKYTHAKTSRHQKTLIIQNIVDLQFHEGVRFLKEFDSGWVVLTRNESTIKVGQSLRDAAAKMNRCLDAGREAAKDKKGWDNSCNFLENICREDNMKEMKEGGLSSAEYLEELGSCFPMNYFLPNKIVTPLMVGSGAVI